LTSYIIVQQTWLINYQQIIEEETPEYLASSLGDMIILRHDWSEQDYMIVIMLTRFNSCWHY